MTVQPKQWDYDSDTGVCSAQIEEHIFALLYKNDLLTSARWPNSKWSDKSFFDNQNWRQCPESERGTIVDDALAEANLNFTGIHKNKNRIRRGAMNFWDCSAKLLAFLFLLLLCKYL